MGSPSEGRGPDVSSGAVAAKPRVEWADAAKGIAIVLIVLVHSGDWLIDIGAAPAWWTTVSDVFASLRMPLLFVISGLFATKWLTAPWRRLLSRKVLFFTWLFLLWSVIARGPELLVYVAEGGRPSPVSVIGGIVLSPVRPTYELWFIWALALFFVVARATARVPPAWLIGAAAVLAVVGYAVPTPNLGWSGFMKYLVFFLVGIHWRTRVLALQERMPAPVRIAVVTVWAAGAVTVAVLFGDAPIVGVLAPLGVVAGIVIATWLRHLPGLVWLGRNTLSIYLAHPSVICLVVWGLLIGGVTVPAPIAAVSPLLMTVFAVAVSLALEKAVKRTPLDLLFELPRPLRPRDAAAPR